MSTPNRLIAMVFSKKALVAGLTLALISFLAGPSLSAASSSAGIDVYVLHTGKAKKDKDALIEALDGALNVKAYNVDLLKLSDYSGKQKAVAKIGKARHVVILGDGPVKILKGTKISSDATIVSNGTRKVASRSWNLNVVAKGTDVSKLPNKEGHLEVASLAELEASEAVLEAEAVVVENAERDLYRVVGYIVSLRLDE